MDACTAIGQSRFPLVGVFKPAVCGSVAVIFVVVMALLLTATGLVSMDSPDLRQTQSLHQCRLSQDNSGKPFSNNIQIGTNRTPETLNRYPLAALHQNADIFELVRAFDDISLT